MVEHIELSEIEIRSFRGIKNYKLETNNNSIVFCGGNGTGKSSFVNAFEFLFTGKIESLSGIGGLDHEKSIIHMGDAKNDVLVKFEINEHTIERSLEGGLTCDEELEDLANDFKRGSFLLNRQKLLNFINAHPKKRWEEAANIISFNQYDAIEKTFEDCKKSLNKQLKAKKDDLKSNTAKIEEYCELDNVYVKLNETLKKNNIEIIDEDTDLDRFLKENSIEENDLQDISISTINEKYQNQLNIFDRITLDQLKSTDILLSILTNSKKHIEDENADACPVCGRPITPSEITEELEERKRKLEKSNAKLVNWKKENSRLIYQIRDLNNRLVRHDLDELIISLEKLSALEITPSDMDRNILTDLEKELELLETSTEELSETFDIIMLLNHRKKIISELEAIEKQHEVSKTASDLFSQKKKEAIEEKFEEIGEYISKYYKFIHEDDELIDPKVKVKNSKGLLLGMIFDDDESDPRTYASEGHLDSLGLCIFLAFAKLYNRYDLLVLDDIISTVDLEHKEMVINLLFEEFSDYTLIITTHNKLWYEQLQRLASSNNIRHKFTFMEILDWNRAEGPVMSKNPSPKKRIEEYLEANDTYAAGNAIRRHLEFVLGDLCRMNKIPLPIRKYYSVEDYYKPVKNYFLEDIFKNTDVEQYYRDVFKKLEDTKYIGNLLSHKNEENYYLTIGEINKFKIAVYDLENAFKCKTHNKQYFKIDKNRKIGTCRNPKCRDLFKYSRI